MKLLSLALVSSFATLALGVGIVKPAPGSTALYNTDFTFTFDPRPTGPSTGVNVPYTNDVDVGLARLANTGSWVLSFTAETHLTDTTIRTNSSVVPVIALGSLTRTTGFTTTFNLPPEATVGSYNLVVVEHIRNLVRSFLLTCLIDPT